MKSEQAATRTHALRVMSEPEELEKPSLESDSITVDEAIEKLDFGRFQIVVMLILGGIQASDAMEMLLLSVLGEVLRCNWFISSAQVALITTSVFIGMMLGGPFWGRVADRYGRIAVVAVACLVMAYFNLLTALSPSFLWIVFLRAVVGFAIAGAIASVMSAIAEFVPGRTRGRTIITLSLFYGVGSLMISGLSAAVIPKMGWRWLTGSVSLCLLLCLPTFLWLPESPRHLLAAGKTKEAREVLDTIARWNNRPPITKPLRRTEAAHGSSLWKLVRSDHCRTTVVLWQVWICCGFTYYGAILLAAELPTTAHHCLQNRSRIALMMRGPPSPAADTSCCERVTGVTFASIILATCGEFLSMPLNWLLIDSVGRRKAMAVTSLGAAFCFFGLNFCFRPDAVAATLLMLLRGCTNAAMVANYLYTTEVYPTTLRVTGVGCCSSAARIGCMMAPFVAQVVLTEHSVIEALMYFTVAEILIAILVLFLPAETAGHGLAQEMTDDER